MAIIVSNEKDLASHVAMSVAGVQGNEFEMVVVPMSICESTDKAMSVLFDVPAFIPRVDADVLPEGAVGRMSVNLVRTVDDALDSLESSTMVGAADMIAAVSSMAETHVKGRTRKVNMKAFGEIVVDLDRFAAASGLPRTSAEKLEYAAFVREVSDKVGDHKKVMLVMVKGTVDSASGNGGSTDALKPMMARLESRRGSGFEPGADFHARDLASGWQLFHNELFSDLLGWWKAGYHYDVKADTNQGLRISY